jgi:hypothetical protein
MTTSNGQAPTSAAIGKDTFDGIYLVGSMQGASTDAVFQLAGTKLGPWLRRLGDGEIGPGRRWVFREFTAYKGVEGLEVVHAADALFPVVGLAEGADPGAITLGRLNYAEKAAESYELFKRRQADGTVPSDVRFLVSIPSTRTAMMVMIAADAQPVLAPLRDARLREDLERLLEVVPARELAICFDAIESPAWRDGQLLLGGTVTHEELLEGLLAPLSWVPEEVEIGFHLCYGDQNARRDKTVGSVAGEGLDVEFGTEGDERLAGVLVDGYLTALAELGSAIFEQAPRPVQFLHMPTVHGVEEISARDYAPLARLRVPDEAQIYLGVVDLDGGVEATRRHIAAASTALGRFGISTECGIGRVSDEEYAFSIDALAKMAEEIEDGAIGPVPTA